MPQGGLLQLIAHGEQDIVLTGQPEITYVPFWHFLQRTLFSGASSQRTTRFVQQNERPPQYQYPAYPAETFYDDEDSDEEVPQVIVNEITNSHPDHLADCPICLESFIHMEMAITSCNHQVCNTCINKLINQRRRAVCKCPLCRANITDICVDVRRTK